LEILWCLLVNNPSIGAINEVLRWPINKPVGAEVWAGSTELAAPIDFQPKKSD
jgi:hypothetical protein